MIWPKNKFLAVYEKSASRLHFLIEVAKHSIRHYHQYFQFMADEVLLPVD